MAALEALTLTKDYSTRSGALRVLRDCSLSLGEGEVAAILGPSGSGKSTLLNILGTLETPTAGRLSIGGRDPFALAEPDLAAFRNEKIGFVFQDHHLLPQCSVLENVLIPTLVNRTPRVEIEKWARELLDRVGLSHRLDHRPAELSGGERQRVAVARALIHRPLLILADEPTGNLDRHTAQSVADLFFELQRAEEATMIVVTHSLELASRFARRAELLEGKLEAML